MVLRQGSWTALALRKVVCDSAPRWVPAWIPGWCERWGLTAVLLGVHVVAVPQDPLITGHRVRVRPATTFHFPGHFHRSEQPNTADTLTLYFKRPTSYFLKLSPNQFSKETLVNPGRSLNRPGLQENAGHVNRYLQSTSGNVVLK